MTKTASGERVRLTHEIIAKLNLIHLRVDGNFTGHERTNWGHVGTLEKVHGDLAEIIRFIGIE